MKKWLIVAGLLISVFTLSSCHHYSLAQRDPEPMPIFTPPSSPKVAVVLGGGGSKGLAHLGVLRELEEAGIHPDLIVGCSSGALIGALYADWPDVTRLEKILLNLKRRDLLDISFFAFRFGLVRGESLEKFLKKTLNANCFSALKIPLIVVATDLYTGELLEFGGGPLIPALCSSSAIPGVFQPVYYLGRHLVDGGTVSPIPVQVAKKYGPQVIIAVDVGEKLSEKQPGHFVGIAKRGFSISYRQLSKESTKGADVLIQMNFEDLGMFSDQYNREIYEYGRLKARESLPFIRQVISEKMSHAR